VDESGLMFYFDVDIIRFPHRRNVIIISCSCKPVHVEHLTFSDLWYHETSYDLWCHKTSRLPAIAVPGLPVLVS
jgi:hypothetical protein